MIRIMIYFDMEMPCLLNFILSSYYGNQGCSFTPQLVSIVLNSSMSFE